MTTVTVLLAFCLPGQPQADPPPISVEQQVKQLVRQLDDSQRTVRDAAENALLKLGTEVLTLLPPTDKNMPPETAERLARVRRQLEQARAQQTTESSRLTLEGNYSLDELLAEIERQTGNHLEDFRGRLRQSQDPMQLDLDLQDIPFWPAIHQLLDQADLSIYTYVGKPRTLGIVQRAMGEQPLAGSACTTGLFRISPLELVAQRSLRSSIQRTLRLRLEVLWEPRVVPVLLRQSYADVSATGEDGSRIPIVVDRGSVEIPVQNTVAGVEMILPMELPPRSLKRIARLEGRLTALVPGREETFEFENLAEAREVVQQKGGLVVTLDRVRRSGALCEFRVRVRMADAEEAFQSHLDWATNNVVYLLAADGTRIDNPNFERYLERSNEIGVAYLFPVPPDLTGYRFVYQTPVAIVELTVDYQLTDIELP